MRVWNLRTAALNVALRGHSAAVCAVAISGDGRLIFSGGRDKVLRVCLGVMHASQYVVV